LIKIKIAADFVNNRRTLNRQKQDFCEQLKSAI